MAVQTYVGARYVPKFSELNGGDWDNQYSYEALEIVKNGNDFYTARIPVPAGIDISDTTYWVLTGNYNGAIATLTNDVNQLQLDVTDINNELAANKYFVTPEDYGAVADGVTDCTAAIQQAIDENPEAPIYFNAGTYAVSDTLIAKKGVHFLLNANSEIKLTAAKPCLIYDNIRAAQSDPTAFSFTSYISGGVINGNDLADVCIGYNYCQHATFKDMTIKGFKSVGLYTGYNIDGSLTQSGAANLHSNIRIENDLPASNPVTGVYNAIHDNFFDHIQIKDCMTGIVIDNGGNSLHNVHPWITDDSYFDGSIAYKINQTVNKLVDCTADSMQIGIQLIGTGVPTVILDTFRFAFHMISFAAVSAAGGFKFFDITTSDYQIMATNLYCWVDSTYTSGGVFIDTSWYNQTGLYYKFLIKNMCGPSYFFARVANIVPDPSDPAGYLGVKIPASADLNSYGVGGEFYCVSGADASTIANKPPGFANTMFTLKVENAVAMMRQIYMMVDASDSVAHIAIRYRAGGTWGNWRVVDNY